MVSSCKTKSFCSVAISRALSMNCSKPSYLLKRFLNKNNNNLFTYNTQVSIYISTCAELKIIKKTNHKSII